MQIAAIKTGRATDRAGRCSANDIRPSHARAVYAIIPGMLLKLEAVSMSAKLSWVVLLVMALSVGAPGQDYEEPRRPQRIPTEGFWPTRLMIDRFIDRVTEDMGKRYEFDEDQLFQTREVIKERLPRWLNDNRGNEVSRYLRDYTQTYGSMPRYVIFDDKADPTLFRHGKSFIHTDSVQGLQPAHIAIAKNVLSGGRR